MEDISTCAEFSVARTCDSSLQTNRSATPQSLENSRGVGINLTVNPPLSRIFSARSADEFVWNKITPKVSIFSDMAR